MVLELVRWRSDRETAVFLDGAEHGGFEPGEGKIEIGDLWMGKIISVGVAILSTFSDGGAARVGETEDFGDFVKTFANGIVSSGADDFKLVMSGHVDDLGVATRDDKGKEGKAGHTRPQFI